MARILVTGATGFIGRALAPALHADGHDVLTPGRAEVGDMGPGADWARFLEGVEAVIHLAGLAHARYGEAELMRVNAGGALALAAQAARAGVGRFVLMSSVKAAADESGDVALAESAPAKPGAPYGRSKRVGEQAVLAHASLRPVVLRPPLVHGPGAKANFATLMRLAASPLPLPLASLTARRSVIARDSLIGAVKRVLARPDAASGAYFVADRPALTVAEIVAALRSGLQRAPGLFGAPITPFAPAALRENLVVDDSAFRAAFGFEGADSRAALAATAAAWKTRA